MTFAQSSLRASAHNTANVETDGFTTERVLGTSAPGGGVRATIGQRQASGQDRTIAESLPGPQNDVNLVRETVNRIAAVRSFEANAKVVRTQDQLSQSLVDLTA